MINSFCVIGDPLCLEYCVQNRNSLFKNAFAAGHQWLAARHQWLTPVILAIYEVKIRRITVQGQSRQVVHKTPSSKITRAKWTESVAEAEEYLLWKCEALSSKSSPTKKKKRCICHT
jgi:hypothetical protein